MLSCCRDDGREQGHPWPLTRPYGAVGKAAGKAVVRSSLRQTAAAIPQLKPHHIVGVADDLFAYQANSQGGLVMAGRAGCAV